ncbi:MAG: bifunctional phosphoglucose/phosphomannose isomerase [Candidatus Bathyarchaeota archaeon]|nr:bifunctional phosphoglucose/phosphomannose isomerase [Candidatus Bathyarchaeota archaeon]MDW8039988.1 bifunctional phosphoglucose/phosphomannose isomerase [Nitrososphaerota archaeon]
MSRISVLDDPARIKEIDRKGMLSFCVEAPKHHEYAVKIAEKVEINHLKPKAIIVAGMGASAIGGEILKDWGQGTLAIPLEVCRGYTLPAYANEETIAVILSYSGETEETLSCLFNAIEKKCNVFCVSSDGTMLKMAEKLKIPVLQVPEGIPPRAALPYLFTPLLVFLEKLNLISNVKEEISEAIKVLEHVCSENSPEKPLRINFSKKLAVNLEGTIPLIYGFGFYRSVAQRFKQQFNENSKIPAFWNVFPELNHNEIVGWENAEKLAKSFSAVLIRDENEPTEIKSHIAATKEILNDEGIETYEVWGKGRGKLAKMLSTVLIGDFTSVYLAILRGVDPTPVRTISELKEKIAKAGTRNRIIQRLMGKDSG